MPNLLKPHIKLTLMFTQSTDEVLALMHEHLGADWQIQAENLSPDTISFLALHEGVEVEGLIERWQGTETRLQIDGKVSHKTPYEDWRDWSGVIGFAALTAILLLAIFLPQTEITVLQLYLLMTSSGLMIMLSSFLSLSYFLGIPFLLQRYFTQLSPDIRLYGEAQSHLADFVAQMKILQSLPLDTSRLELEDDEADIEEIVGANYNAEAKTDAISGSD